MAVIVVIEERKKLLDTPRFRVVLEHAVMMIRRERERGRENSNQVVEKVSGYGQVTQRKKKRKSIGIEWG